MLLLWFESHPDHYLDLFPWFTNFFNQTSLIFISIIDLDYHNLESETKENENQNNLNILKPNKR